MRRYQLSDHSLLPGRVVRSYAEPWGGVPETYFCLRLSWVPSFVIDAGDAGGRRAVLPAGTRAQCLLRVSRWTASESWRVPVVWVLAARPRAVERACREAAPLVGLTT
jgi:hypothetical protein